jgi:hypothetical protein
MTLQKLDFSEEERMYLTAEVSRLRGDWEANHEALSTSLRLRLAQNQDRLRRLTDAYIDRMIDKELFEERKEALLFERREIEESLAASAETQTGFAARLGEILELAANASLRYEMAEPDEKRDLLKLLTSNRTVECKTLGFMLSPPFDEIAKRLESSYGAPYRDIPRTWTRLIGIVTDCLTHNPAVTLRLSSDTDNRSPTVDAPKTWKLAA